MPTTICLIPHDAVDPAAAIYNHISRLVVAPTQGAIPTFGCTVSMNALESGKRLTRSTNPKGMALLQKYHPQHPTEIPIACTIKNGLEDTRRMGIHVNTASDQLS